MHLKNNSHYRQMSDIMLGRTTTAEILKFIEEREQQAFSTSELSHYLQAIRDTATFVLDANEHPQRVVDIAGTGGDGHHTVNISTLAGLVCAATNQVKVCKYGNRSASGICGSMDVLENVGIKIEKTPAELAETVHQSSFTPLFARTIYPGARHTAEARSVIGRPTMFNLLFALARPITGSYSFLMGFAKLENLQLAAELLSHDKATCLLVRGTDGTDEVSVTGDGTTDYIMLKQGQKTTGRLDYARLFGNQPFDISALQIHSKAEATELFLPALDPAVSNERITAIRESMLVNAAATLSAASLLDDMNVETSLLHHYHQVREALESGQALDLLVTLQEN